jgi:D-inositol-3-phosphate glycosyltransferase
MRIFVASAAGLLTDSRAHGEGLIAWQTFSGLAARGHDLVVCTRRAELQSEPPFTAVELGRTSGLESLEPLAYARAVDRTLSRFGGADSFDVAHWLFPQAPDETVWAPPRGLRFVVGPHSLVWPGGRGRPLRAGDAVRAVARPLFRARRRRAFAAASAVLVSTPAAVSAVPAGARTRVVPFGVDASRFTPAPLPAEPTVLFVGRLEPAKGVRDLVEAFARVRVRGARLLLAGDGPEQAWIEAEKERLGLNGSVLLLGAVPHDEVPGLLERAALVCLPSHGEPFGMALLEAMAAGRAVVATSSGGPRFLVDERGGRLVAPGDPEALAGALAELLDDPALLGRMGRFNRERVERELSLERTLDALEEAYAG